MRHKLVAVFLYFLCAFSALPAMAVQYPRPFGQDPRIKVLNYDPNSVHVYTGFYGYQSSIVFEDGENIEMVSMGDSTAWQLVPQGNRLMLKPIDDDAATNVTVITSKRVYHFEFHADEASSISDPDIAFEVRFQYPFSYEGAVAATSGGGGSFSGTRQYSEIEIPDVAAEFDNLNFRYMVSGSERIAPIMAFDDGEFTYIKYSRSSDFPAAFLVNEDGYESLVNFKSRDGYMVVERVGSVFTLRYGNEIACLFNEAIPFHKKKVTKRKVGIFGKHVDQ